MQILFWFNIADFYCYGMKYDVGEVRLEKNLLTGTVPFELCRGSIDYLSSDCNGAKIECSCCNNCPKGRSS